MAHSCPICDCYCTCGGDWDDIELNGTEEQNACMHCSDDEELDEAEEWPDEDESDIELPYEPIS